MVLSQSQIRDNPWWRQAEAINEDTDLRRFDTTPLRFEHAVPFDLDVDAVFTLRGPRQVGKSTHSG
jgi:predicted AAA+ superfamily ATPase